MLDLHTLQKVENWLTVRSKQQEDQLKNTSGFERELIAARWKILDEAKDEIIRKRLDIEKHQEFQKVQEKTCPTCGHVSKRYKISFSSLHVKIAKILYEYCVKNKTHNVTKTELAPYLSHTDYGNFYILQRFGLIYFEKDENGKKKKGVWGVPLKTLHKFLKNEWKIAEYFWRDKDNGTNEMSERRIFLYEVPKITRAIDYETMLPTFLEFETDPYFQYTP